MAIPKLTTSMVARFKGGLSAGHAGQSFASQAPKARIDRL